MFGMDMAFGADMMGMGAMDMGMGARDMRMGEMDMAMGRPLLGAEMMGMGARDMRMGEMEMGMGMGMMDRGMMGRDMMGMDMMGMEMGMGMGVGMMEMDMMGGGIGICPPGCMRTCCRPVVVCPPGCMGPCCINKQVIVRTVPSPQYNNNSGFVQLPPVPRAQYYQKPQQPRTYETTPMNADIQEQIIGEQARIQREKNEQLLYKQRLEQEKLQLQKQRLEFEQRQIQNQRNEQIRLQQMQQNQRLEKLKVEQVLVTQAQYNVQKNASFAIDQQYIQSNPYGNQIIFEGDIYQKLDNLGQWEQVKGQLTLHKIIGFNLENITKIKVKYATHVPNYRIIKLTIHGRGDIFIAVPAQDQSEWMCRIIWARFNKMNRPFNQNEAFSNSYEGEIVRKSFFNGWEIKFASVSASGLKIYNNLGGSMTHNIIAVPQIWTRFDLVHGNMLIIKFHVTGRKNEIGIPIDHAMPWLKGLYNIVRPF